MSIINSDINNAKLDLIEIIESLKRKYYANIDSHMHMIYRVPSGKGHECNKGVDWQWPLKWLNMTYMFHNK